MSRVRGLEWANFKQRRRHGCFVVVNSQLLLGKLSPLQLSIRDHGREVLIGRLSPLPKQSLPGKSILSFFRQACRYFMRIRGKRYMMEVRKYENCLARFCLFEEVSLDGAGDAFLRDF
jgi:hypothetical protein